MVPTAFRASPVGRPFPDLLPVLGELLGARLQESGRLSLGVGLQIGEGELLQGGGGGGDLLHQVADRDPLLHPLLLLEFVQQVVNLDAAVDQLEDLAHELDVARLGPGHELEYRLGGQLLGLFAQLVCFLEALDRLPEAFAVPRRARLRHLDLGGRLLVGLLVGGAQDQLLVDAVQMLDDVLPAAPGWACQSPRSRPSASGRS